MTSFNTETDTMAQAARQVDDVNAQIEGQLRTLSSQLAPLANAWQGQASTSFQALMVRFNENADKLRAALQGISTEINSSSVTYATEDEAQQQAMSNITNALG